jgi:hypothetical protein
MRKPLLYGVYTYTIMNPTGGSDVEVSEVGGSFYSWPRVVMDIPKSAVPGHVPIQCSALLFVLNRPSVFSHVE